ncbi:protein disulfide-isomerase [Physcia stellaris]|nr:protein disulfide-isomerase [Physcia stellaris]
MADEKTSSPAGIEKESISLEDGSPPMPRGRKHAHDADEAMKAFQDGEIEVLDEATNKRLLRTIDRNIMPVETTLSYASVMGIKKDANLTGDDYNWVSSMFYFGYLAWEYPTNRLLQRLPLAKYSSFCIIVWGLVLCCMAAITNSSSALAVRFFLGVFEAAVTPGFSSSPRNAYGIARGASLHGSAIAPWKIVFLVTGLLTAALGVVFWFVMPDNQLNARWLSVPDRRRAIERVRINQQGIGNKHFKPYQLKEALTDPLTWAFFFYALTANIPNGGISNFFSQLIVSFGYTPEQSLLYGTPGGAVEVVTLIFCGYVGDRYGNRILLGATGILLGAIGMILIIALPLSAPSGRLAGYYLTQAAPTGFVALLSLISSNVAGYTKKTTVAALYLMAYCIGNIIGPQTFRPKDAPRYIPAEVTIIVCWGACLLDFGFIYWYCRWQNRRKAEWRARPEYRKLENQEWLDLTDRCVSLLTSFFDCRSLLWGWYDWDTGDANRGDDRENPEFVYTI